MDELGGEPQATVIGSPRRLPAANAAFANAMLCHGLDFDDTHSDSVSHVSTVIAPAALARGGSARLGRSATCSPRSIAGNEVVCRIGMAASGEFHRRGFHPTAICGVFGGVAAVAKLTGLEAETTTRALGIAGSFASGLFAYLADGTPTKPMHPAWAAHGAHIAARLAHHGASGPQSVLEGKFGLYHAFLGAEQGAVDIAAQLADLGSRWETPRIAYKPYPVCHFMHGSLGSAAAGHGRAHVHVRRDRRRARPGARRRRLPRARAGGAEAGAALRVRGQVLPPVLGRLACSCVVMSSVGDFTDEAITDPEVLAVAAKVRYETREYPTYPQAFPGGVVVRLADGTELEADFPYQKGGPENPLSPDEVRAKFRENASLALPDADVAALDEAVLSLEEQADLTAALAPLQLLEIARA